MTPAERVGLRWSVVGVVRFAHRHAGCPMQWSLGASRLGRSALVPIGVVAAGRWAGHACPEIPLGPGRVAVGRGHLLVDRSRGAVHVGLGGERLFV